MHRDGDRYRTFSRRSIVLFGGKIALLSGLVEPIGALAAALFLVSFKNLIPIALAFAAGVMVFITLDELIPTAREHGHQHYTAIGVILGAIFVFLLSGIFGHILLHLKEGKVSTNESGNMVLIRK